MQRVKRSTAVAVMPAMPAGGTPGFFAHPDPVGGVPATVPGFEWYNCVQEELVAVIAAAGIALDVTNTTQLLAALRAAGVFQTAGQFDASTKAATTAFVQRALGNFQGTISYAAPTSIPSSAVGSLISIASGANTLTLPALASCAAGSKLHFFNSGQPGAVIQRAGADTLSANGNVLTSFTLGLGDTISFTNFGQSVWLADSGTARDGYSAAFGNSLTANGYQKLPSGLILQLTGGANIAASGTQVITLPTAFPNGHFRTLVTSVYASAAQSGGYGFISANGTPVVSVTVARNNVDNANGVTPVILSLGY